MGDLGMNERDVDADLQAMQEAVSIEPRLVTPGDQDRLKAESEVRTNALAKALTAAKEDEQEAFAAVRKAAHARGAASLALQQHMEQVKQREETIAADWAEYRRIRASRPRVFPNGSILEMQ